MHRDKDGSSAGRSARIDQCRNPIVIRRNIAAVRAARSASVRSRLPGIAVNSLSSGMADGHDGSRLQSMMRRE